VQQTFDPHPIQIQVGVRIQCQHVHRQIAFA
jgi:hypothetical protein